MLAITQNVVHEWSFILDQEHNDPSNDVELDVLFTHEEGERMLVPAFWDGDQLWRVRFSTPRLGTWTYSTKCPDTGDPYLDGVRGEFKVVPYRGPNPLHQHGPLQVSRDHRYLQHVDGTPFFWLADTWWMGLCDRLSWPHGFQTLAMDRVAKGFNVIQIVAGLYPDMAGFDPRSANEGGFPWTEGYARINPDYFAYADRRIAYLVDLGLTPCIVGCWGYYLPVMGVDRINRHWRYLIARYGAYPVVWCLAGEQTMPYYLSEDREGDARTQSRGWSEVARYVRRADPFRRPVTVHPGQPGREQMASPDLIDFEMLQTGHSDRQSLPNTVESMKEAVEREPTMPVIDAEVCYEGIGQACRQEVQRLMFWVCMLSGAAGHSYGASGIWQVNTRSALYGPSPLGMVWGTTPWEDAYQLPGSHQLGLGKRLLERYPWWRFVPHPEWAEPRWRPEDYMGGYAAGIPGKVRVLYWPSSTKPGTVKGIEPGVSYRAYLFNPVNGEQLDLGAVVPDEEGNWPLPLGEGPRRRMPIYQDWVLVLES